MSRYFGDLTLYMISGCFLNIPLAINLRRVKMEREGWFTENINWEHYIKVLEAKQKLIKEEI